MLGPAPVIHSPTNPAFRFGTNPLNTALLTRLLFHLLLLVCKSPADGVYRDVVERDTLAWCRDCY